MHIGVLGGGALGLTAAMRLAQRGAKVTILEKEEALGGLASGFLVGDSGTYLEKFYHHIFRSDKEIQALLTELGLGDKLKWHNTITSTLLKGKMWEFSPRTLIMGYKPIPLPSRVRLMAVMAYLKLTKDYKRLRKYTAAQWLGKWMGKRAYETQFKPLFVGKFSQYYEDIAMPWFWSRVHERSFDLGYLHGGFQQLYDRLGEEVKRAGGDIHLGTSVTRVASVEGGKTLVETDGGPYTFDAVVSTLPTRLFLRLAEGLPENYRKRFDWGNALGAHVVILALKQSLLDPVYWLNINDPGYPFLVAVDHTNMIPPSEYGGRYLLYLGNYLPMDHRYFKEDDERVIEEFLPHLKRLNPEFSEDWVTDYWVFKAPFAQPVVTREYEAHIPPLTTPLPNVYMGNMFQVYPQDRGQNYSIKLAERLVKLIK